MFNLSGKNEERTEQMRQTARDLKMKFVGKDEYGMTALLRDFHLFSRGGSKAITNLLTHTSELMEDKVHVFDFKYRVSTGKSSQTHEQTVFFINSKRLAMPEMLMKPEHFFHKIGAWFGMQDIDFQEHKEFSDHYLLQGEDEPHIRRTISNKHVIRFFTIEKNWCLESIGYFLIFYQPDLLVHPSQIKYLHAKGMSLFEQFKTEPL